MYTTRRDSTRQLIHVGVGSVYWALHFISANANADFLSLTVEYLYQFLSFKYCSEMYAVVCLTCAGLLQESWMCC